jgi:phage terminase small subunit
MTKAQKNFIANYIEADFKNATAAYMGAYPDASEETARRNASRLLTNADIQKYMAAALEEIIRREKIPIERRVLDYWTRRAFYDPAEIIDAKGALLHPLAELSVSGLSVCVESIETRVNSKGAETTKIKLADRDKALEMLQQYVQMIKPQTHKIEIDGISDEARARLAALYDEETPIKTPGHVEPQEEAPDDDERGHPENNSKGTAPPGAAYRQRQIDPAPFRVDSLLLGQRRPPRLASLPGRV